MGLTFNDLTLWKSGNAVGLWDLWDPKICVHSSMKRLNLQLSKSTPTPRSTVGKGYLHTSRACERKQCASTEQTRFAAPDVYRSLLWFRPFACSEQITEVSVDEPRVLSPARIEGWLRNAFLD